MPRARTKAVLLKEIAASLDAPRALVPFLPELFADLDSLGSTPRRVARWLAHARMGQSARIVDMGCGKGAAAVEVACVTGAQVLGVDAFGPFIESARVLAARRGVTERCRFETGDAFGFPSSRHRFSAAMMLGVAPLEVARSLLRPLVKRGGYYIIDDAVELRRGRGIAAALDAAARGFHELGDVVVRQHALAPAEVKRLEARLRQSMKARASLIARRRPETGAMLREYLANQRRAARVLTTSLRPVLWMVRKEGR